jgi:hypothetical protein
LLKNIGEAFLFAMAALDVFKLWFFSPSGGKAL